MKDTLPSERQPLTLDRMRRAVAGKLGEAEAAVGDDDNLIGLGLDSISIMELMNGWRREGVELSYAALLERPTLAAWWEEARGRRGAPAAAEAEPTVDESAPFELAPMQQAYWIGAHADQVMGGVNAHYYVELDGREVDPARLEQAVRALLARHGLLRARFSSDGRQQVLPQSPWPGLTVHDLRRLDEDRATRRLEELRRTLGERQLRVERAEVLDVQLSLLPEGRTRVHVNVEMLVCDARSFQVLLGDLASLYESPAEPLPPITHSFQRHLAAQARRRSERYERARAYWRQRLPELPGAPQLPLAVEPAQLTARRMGRRVYRLAPERQRALLRRARAEGLTPASALATAFAEVLAAWSGEPRFLLNLPLFDREELWPDTARVVGDFSNLLILAADLSAEVSFAEQARRLQARLTEDVEHRDYSGLDVLRDLTRSRAGDSILAPVVFTSVVGMGELFGGRVRRSLGAPAWISSQTPQVWLDHQVIESEGGLLFNWDVVEGLFRPGVVDAMFEAHVRIVEWLARDDADWSQPAPIELPPAQLATRAAANATAQPLVERTLAEGFFACARREPGRVALWWGDDGALRYGELAAQSLAIAALLGRHGVAPGEPVAVSCARGPQQIAAVLGVLAAGAAYVPIAVDQPEARRAQICATVGVRVVLSGAREAAAMRWSELVRVVCLEDAASVAPLAAPVAVDPRALAYVICTSGSTGVPKAIEMSHRAAMNTIDDIDDRFGVGPDDRVLAISSLEFDLSVYDLFGMLSRGAAVVLVDETERREARRWAELIERHGVTLWNSVPALLDMLLTAVELDDGPRTLPLRLALVSGDWVGLDLPARLRRLCPFSRFVALGGATEAAIWSNAYEVGAVDPAWRSIPYGFPLRNQTFKAVDGRGRLCPDWVPGELWIGGAGVALGYRGDPERTAAQFVTADGQRWYRTGDRGRYWPDGAIEFLGRVDHQVKLKGHRIELGEIEAALEQHPAVMRAIALVAGKSQGRLAAVVVPRPGEAVDMAALRDVAAARLPSYMVPDAIVTLAALPLTATGKVDRKALAALLADDGGEREDEPPVGEVEAALARSWCAVLGLERVGRRRSFFELGGDSLTAIRLLEAVRKELRVAVTHRQLLLTPTIEMLAQQIERGNDAVEEGVI